MNTYRYPGLCTPILLSAFALQFYGCSKHDSSPPPPIPLAITALSVTHGPEYTTVTITGTGFSSTQTNDQVFFNGTQATLSAASSTQLTTTVPRLSGTGTVSVKVSGQQVTGPVFTYDYSDAQVTTIAGGPSSTALSSPVSIVLDAGGNFFVTDVSLGTIFQVSSGGTINALTSTNQFNFPVGLVQNAAGNFYLCDEGTQKIYSVSQAGIVSVLAGSGSPGHQNGTGTAAWFSSPSGIALDPTGNLLVTELSNHMIRKVTPAGVVSDYAGTGANGLVNGPANMAQFSLPTGLCTDPAGNVYVADQVNACIRKITTAGQVSTLAGMPFTGTPAFADGDADTTKFKYPNQVLAIPAGLLVAEYPGRLRLITPQGKVVTVAGTTISGFADGNKSQSKFFYIGGMTADRNGIVYVTDQGNKAIRKVVLE